jgi:hypothetical protein
VPFPTDAIEALASSRPFADADAAKRKAIADAWQPLWQSVPKREGAICLPSASGLRGVTLAALDAASAADQGKAAAFASSAQGALKSVSKGSSYRVFSEYGRQERAVVAGASFQERDRLKKSTAEVAAAAQVRADLKAKQALGPPKWQAPTPHSRAALRQSALARPAVARPASLEGCVQRHSPLLLPQLRAPFTPTLMLPRPRPAARSFTIGCTANYENDLWRNDPRDDYTGEGLEKPTGILKPGKFEFKQEE